MEFLEWPVSVQMQVGTVCVEKSSGRSPLMIRELTAVELEEGLRGSDMTGQQGVE